ncbi:MAG: metal-dependent transcriptional regulator [Flavobacteriaceae bacterium]
MITYNPIYALLIFVALSLLLYFIFKPKTGWYWIVRKNNKNQDKIVVEDILKHMFHTESDGDVTNENSLIENLSLQKDTLKNSLQTMQNNGLIVNENSELSLSNSGRDYALRIIRIHRLWEKYLAEKTGFDKKEWHQRAERKEHELNVEETNLLSAKLGEPKFDPHGDPIPSTTGKMATLNGVSLIKLPVYAKGRIVHIEDEPALIYKQILAEDIHIGSYIKVLENNEKRVVFYSEGEEFKLAPEVANNLTIEIENEANELEENYVRLSSLKLNETAKITGLSKECRGDNRRRLLDLGFVKGADISIALENPLSNPTAYLIKGTSIALRKSQAVQILIIKEITNE